MTKDSKEICKKFLHDTKSTVGDKHDHEGLLQIDEKVKNNTKDEC